MGKTAKWHEEIWAGLARFCWMYYIISLNAQILSEIGIPQSATFFATFLVIVLFNISGISLTGTGLMIAPAVGISTFVKHFVISAQHESQGVFGWQDAMKGCAFAGVLLVVTSLLFTSLRSQIIEDMPESVKKGAKAAIGSLLASEAIEQYNKFTGKGGGVDPGFAFWSVSLAVIVIIGFFAARNMFRQTGSTAISNILLVLLRAEFLLVVLGMSLALHVFQPHYIASLPRTTEFSWLWQAPGALAFHSGFITNVLLGVLTIMIWFIVVTDIPGTPSAVLPPDVIKADSNRVVRRGYINDAFAAMFSPLCGTTPTIYYAENQILGDFKAFTPLVGATATGLFAFFALAIGWSTLSGQSLSVERILPPFALLPVLLAIGLYIVAISFADEPVKKDVAAPEKIAGGPEEYFPAAIAVILTPQIGLEYAFPLSILSYWCVGKKQPSYGTFSWVTVGAAVSLAIEVAIHNSL
jgi:xanthine/uracil/vitamin C permease (AzgA family)